MNEKNIKISSLETDINRLQMLVEHSKVIKENSSQRKASEPSEEDKGTDEVLSRRLKKCKFENSGTCSNYDRCTFFHPKETCQNHSKLGSCSQEKTKDTYCDLRHPKKICSRLEKTGYCSYGDRCRERHPLEYAVTDYNSKLRLRNLICLNNNNILGSSPRASQSPGWTQGQHPSQQHHPHVESQAPLPRVPVQQHIPQVISHHQFPLAASQQQCMLAAAQQIPQRAPQQQFPQPPWPRQQHSQNGFLT